MICKDMGGDEELISYIGLEKILKERGLGKTELSTEVGLSTRTVA